MVARRRGSAEKARRAALASSVTSGVGSFRAVDCIKAVYESIETDAISESSRSRPVGKGDVSSASCLNAGPNATRGPASGARRGRECRRCHRDLRIGACVGGWPRFTGRLEAASRRRAWVYVVIAGISPRFSARSRQLPWRFVATAVARVCASFLPTVPAPLTSCSSSAGTAVVRKPSMFSVSVQWISLGCFYLRQLPRRRGWFVSRRRRVYVARSRVVSGGEDDVVRHGV